MLHIRGKNSLLYSLQPAGNMRLHPIKSNGNKYCGPAAISAITGIGTKQAAAIIRSRGRTLAVKSTNVGDVAMAMDTLGYSVKIHSFKRDTLLNYVKACCAADEMYLLAVSHHWIVVYNGVAVCSIIKQPVAVADHSFRRKFVMEAYVIRQVRKVDVAEVEQAYSPKVDKSEAAARAKVKRLAKKHGFLAGRESGMESIGVFPPDSFYRANRVDPFEGDHYCGSWTEALKLATKYAEILSPIQAA